MGLLLGGCHFSDDKWRWVSFLGGFRKRSLPCSGCVCTPQAYETPRWYRSSRWRRDNSDTSRLSYPVNGRSKRLAALFEPNKKQILKVRRSIFFFFFFGSLLLSTSTESVHPPSFLPRNCLQAAVLLRKEIQSSTEGVQDSELRLHIQPLFAVQRYEIGHLHHPAMENEGADPKISSRDS